MNYERDRSPKEEWSPISITNTFMLTRLISRENDSTLGWVKAAQAMLGMLLAFYKEPWEWDGRKALQKIDDSVDGG